MGSQKTKIWPRIKHWWNTDIRASTGPGQQRAVMARLTFVREGGAGGVRLLKYAARSYSGPRNLELFATTEVDHATDGDANCGQGERTGFGGGGGISDRKLGTTIAVVEIAEIIFNHDVALEFGE